MLERIEEKKKVYLIDTENKVKQIYDDKEEDINKMWKFHSAEHFSIVKEEITNFNQMLYDSKKGCWVKKYFYISETEVVDKRKAGWYEYHNPRFIIREPVKYEVKTKCK